MSQDWSFWVLVAIWDSCKLHLLNNVIKHTVTNDIGKDLKIDYFDAGQSKKWSVIYIFSIPSSVSFFWMDLFIKINSIKVF